MMFIGSKCHCFWFFLVLFFVYFFVFVFVLFFVFICFFREEVSEVERGKCGLQSQN